MPSRTRPEERLAGYLLECFSPDELLEIEMACEPWYGRVTGPGKLRDLLHELLDERELHRDLKRRTRAVPR